MIELDPRDYQVALDQARAQYDQAVAQAQASHPNLPITLTTNRTDLASQQAQVANAEAAVAAARHDLDTAVARLKESEATNERHQANSARYQTVSRADYDQYKAAAGSQIQTVEANRASVASSLETVAQRVE